MHGEPLTEKLVGPPGLVPADEITAPILTVFFLFATSDSQLLLPSVLPVTVPPEKLFNCKTRKGPQELGMRTLYC